MKNNVIICIYSAILLHIKKKKTLIWDYLEIRLAVWAQLFVLCVSKLAADRAGVLSRRPLGGRVEGVSWRKSSGEKNPSF